MFICNHCGATFESPEYNDSAVCDNEVCPDCGSSAFDEAVMCKGCGEWIARMDAYGYSGNLYCKDCIDDTKADIDFLAKATDDTEDIEVPALYRYIFSDDEIASILYHAALEKRRTGDLDTSSYVDYYANDIAEALDTERRKNDHGEDAGVAARAS